MHAIIFHATGGTPTDFWYGWLADKLRARGYTVDVPNMPDINQEDISTFLPKIMQQVEITPETVLIGHSAGATLILSIGEKIPFKQGVLVSGFSLPYDGVEKDPILQDTYSWKKIRSNCADFVFVNSANDPWGCDDKQGRVMFDELGGTQIIRMEGHFGSHGAKQEFPEFPLLERLVA
jgi:predicted alpha/beta hydrolase family esterase